jgi:predicted amidohydrolase
LSWTATDANPDTYTIELQGTGIVAGPTAWTSGNVINYNIPDGYNVGSYIYTIIFTDDYDHFITDSVTFTVDEDTTNPTITNAPSDLNVEAGYTGQGISWTATDPNPNTYTIELQGSGIVAGPTAWTSGNAITYNIPDGFSVGSYVYTVNFTDDYGNFIIDSVTFTVGDTTNPTITNAPSDFTVETGYTGQSISWTATDPNPNTYTIELQGSGIVAGPTAWTSGNAINYNIPDGFGVGSHIYTVSFTDDYDNFITDSVNFTVEEDTTNPVITVSPNNFTVEAGYTGQSISWTATDANPYNYTIELQGTEIVAGPTAWTSGNAINYNIPDGFGVGSYVYTVNFTDDYGNFIIDSVTFTVGDTTNPTIISAPSDLTVEFGYTGQSISWRATDSNPNTYTIELQGSGIVAGPTVWTSGNAINYNIPDGFAVGVYVYTVNFTDDYDNFITDSVTFTVGDTTNPTITSAPSDLTVEFGYTGVSIAWRATDSNPNTYTIELQGSGIVAGPTAWTSGVAITYNIPDGYSVGS